MSKISKNIRVLRNQKKMSQEDLADTLDITRARLGAYEENRNEPPIALLIKMADYFNISVDALIRGDLENTSPDSLMKIGKNRILLPVMVDNNNNDLIEVVSVKASAGYLRGYGDPEFIQSLPIMNLPFKIVGKHRAFGIKGDSMPPLREGATVVGRYVESLNEIKDGATYIVVTKEDGIVYKRLYRKNPKVNDQFIFKSDNPVYEPYTIASSEIVEVWSFVCSLNIGEFNINDMNIENMIRFLQSYRVEMQR